MEEKELLETIAKLKEENRKLKARLNKNKRKPIKTTKKEIADYWGKYQEECGLSVDWSEAEERCWRCGYKKPLERCHIIPDSLGGEDKPENLVLLCKRCHIEAPNVESKTFMWEWLRAYGTPFYDTFWKIRAYEEYKFIYKKSFFDELKDRDIISDRDFRRFWNINIGKSSIHFGHPWYNTATDAGVLKMHLDAYDEKYKSKKPKSKNFRNKEEKFENIVMHICDIAEKYKWNVWEGETQNLFSITISRDECIKNKCAISVKLCRDGIYRACFTSETNPNRNKSSEYTIEIGKENKDVESFIKQEINKIDEKYGESKKRVFVFTTNPIYENSFFRKD